MPDDDCQLSACHRERLLRQFASEPAYRYVGLMLLELERGVCATHTPIREELLHHRGAVQGGLAAMIADATAGYAALATLKEQPASDVATIEFKTSFFRPLVGQRAICRAVARFPARATIFCRAQVFSDVEDEAKLCAEASLTFKQLRFS